MLDVDAATAQFRVWDCAASLPSPATPASAAAAALPATAPAAAACAAVDHGVWPPLASHGQAVWLGGTLGDALLLFDSASGAYEAWPLRRVAGRTLPRPGTRALASGTWPRLVGRTLVHAGGSTLVALDPSSGSFELLLLDSSAFLLPAAPKTSAELSSPPPVPYGKLASGSLGQPTTASAADVSAASPSGSPPPSRPCAFSYHAPTYLGDDLLLSVEPASGQYCMLRLAREETGIAQSSIARWRQS